MCPTGSQKHKRKAEKEKKEKSEKKTGVSSQSTNVTLDSLLTDESLDINSIENYLHDLSGSSGVKKQTLEKFKNDSKYLYNAASRGDLPLVELLVGFNFSTIAFKGRTQAQIAEKLSEDKSMSLEMLEKFKEIAAYIYFREKWQRKTISKENFSLNCSIRLLLKGMNAVKDIDKNVVLVFGRTQRGKSTFVNYLLGTDYELDLNPSSNRAVARHIGGEEETVGVGDSSTSYTLYPTLCPIRKTSYALVDMPGFGDVRGSEEEICTTLSSQILFKKIVSPCGVSAIIFVLSYNDVCENAYSHLRVDAAKIGKILKDASNSKRLLLIISQIPKDISMGTVKKTATIHLTNLKSAIEDELSGKSSETEPDKRNTLLILNAILSNPTNIFAGDVFTENLRKNILEKLEDLNTARVTPSNFDFCFSSSYTEGSYNIHVDKFYEAMKHVITDYNHLKDELRKKESDLAHHFDLLKEADSKQTKLQREITDTEENTRNKEDITAAKTCVSFGEKEISNMEKKSKELEERINELKADKTLYTIKEWSLNENQIFPKEVLEILDMTDAAPEVPVAPPSLNTSRFRLSFSPRPISADEKAEQQKYAEGLEVYNRKKTHYDAILTTQNDEARRSKNGSFDFEAAKEIVIARMLNNDIKSTPFKYESEPYRETNKHIAGFKILTIEGCQAFRLSETGTNETKIAALEANKLYDDKVEVTELRLKIKGLYKHQGKVKFICEVYGYKNQSNETIEEIIRLQGEINDNTKGIEEENRVLIRRNNFLKRQDNSANKIKGLEIDLKKLDDEIVELREKEKRSRSNYEEVARRFSVNSKCFKEVQELLRIIGHRKGDSQVNQFLNEDINADSTHFKRRRDSMDSSLSNQNKKLPRVAALTFKSPAATAPNQSFFTSHSSRPNPPPVISLSETPQLFHAATIALQQNQDNDMVELCFTDKNAAKECQQKLLKDYGIHDFDNTHNNNPRKINQIESIEGDEAPSFKIFLTGEEYIMVSGNADAYAKLFENQAVSSPNP